MDNLKWEGDNFDISWFLYWVKQVIFISIHTWYHNIPLYPWSQFYKQTNCLNQPFLAGPLSGLFRQVWLYMAYRRLYNYVGVTFKAARDFGLRLGRTLLLVWKQQQKESRNGKCECDFQTLL